MAPQERSRDDSSDVRSCQLVRVYLSTTAACWEGTPRPHARTHPTPHYQMISPRRGAAAAAFVHARGRTRPPTTPPPPSRNPESLHTHTAAESLRKHATVREKDVPSEEPGFPPRVPCHITHASKVGYGKARARKHSRRAKSDIKPLKKKTLDTANAGFFFN